jgi:hypothetical protein
MISFVETKLLTLVQEYLSDDEYSKLQQALLSDPEAGSVIPGSGGVRKLRWGVAGRGKRVASESSIFFALGRVRFGCSRFTLRMWPRTFQPGF